MVEAAKVSKANDSLGTGRRKTSVARVRVRSGKGTITINDRPMDQFFTESQFESYRALGEHIAKVVFGSLNVSEEVDSGKALFSRLPLLTASVAGETDSARGGILGRRKHEPGRRSRQPGSSPPGIGDGAARRTEIPRHTMFTGRRHGPRRTIGQRSRWRWGATETAEPNGQSRAVVNWFWTRLPTSTVRPPPRRSGVR